MYKCFVCIYVWHHEHAWCLQRMKEGIASPGIGVTDVYMLTCGSWELNANLLQD